MKQIANRIIQIFVCMAVISTLSLPLIAFVPHEDPEKAEIIYDGISLFRYYSEILDSVLAGNHDEVHLKIDRMPLANLPDSLKSTTDDLTSSIYDISRLLIDINQDMLEQNSLLRQQRLVEVAQLSIIIKQNIDSATLNLNTIEDSIIITGNTFSVFSAPAESTLRIAYDDVSEKIAVIRQLLEAYLMMLSGVIDMESEITYTSDNAIILKSLIPTEVTLYIEPTTVFVGENVTVSGRLQSESIPLADRQVHIFLNNSQYLTANTDENGYYRTTLAIPYWYTPEINVKVIYYPQNDDIGVYLSSLSLEQTLSVLFYSAELIIQTAPRAYPGMATTITGSFNYDKFPLLIQREIEVYLDNILFITTDVSTEFSLVLNLDASTSTGNHTIIISAPGTKRYAPVVANKTMNITKALPALTMDFPHVVIVPGKLELSGKLESEVGHLKNADVAISLGNTSMVVKSSGEGTFQSVLEKSMRFELIGSESLVIQVTPEEPWHDTLTISRKVLVLNVINCVIFLVIIVLVGVFLSGRLKSGIKFYKRRKLQPIPTPVADTISIPIPGDASVITDLLRNADKEHIEPKYHIYSWYASLIKIIQKTTNSVLRPNQTLREFAVNTKKTLGPVAELFMELTKIVERLLYSRHQATAPEVEQSKQIVDQIEQGLK